MGTQLVFGDAARPAPVSVTHEKLGRVYIVLGDPRAQDCQTIYLVTAQRDKAYEMAKKLLLRWNKPDKEWENPDSLTHALVRDRDMPAREFCELYLSAWLRSPSIVCKALWG
jgi:hypothetical protein